MDEEEFKIHYESFDELNNDLVKDFDVIKIGGRDIHINMIVIIDKDSDLTKGFPFDNIHTIYLGSHKAGYTLTKGQSFRREKRILEEIPVWKELLEVRKTNESIKDILTQGAEIEF